MVSTNYDNKMLSLKRQVLDELWELYDKRYDKLNAMVNNVFDADIKNPVGYEDCIMLVGALNVFLAELLLRREEREEKAKENP